MAVALIGGFALGYAIVCLMVVERALSDEEDEDEEFKSLARQYEKYYAGVDLAEEGGDHSVIMGYGDDGLLKRPRCFVPKKDEPYVPGEEGEPC